MCVSFILDAVENTYVSQVLKRYEQIAAILIKYGFEIAVVDLLPGTVKLRLNKKHANEVTKLGVNRRLRLAIQEMGPTFVKFGQILSTRRELLSADLINELKLLTDKVEPLPWEKVEPTIMEYCGDIEQNFIYLNKRPFAAASLSQVHHGKLRDGTIVVLKVQRPGIKETIETDLRILKTIVDRAEKTSNSLEIFNFPGMIADFSRQIFSELDFARDGRNADILARNLKNVEGVRVPRIIWKYSGQKLLVMEYMKGVRIDQVEQIKKMGIDTKKLARLGFRVYMKQIFEDGLFHGDPHPGNLLVNSKGELVLLDFGLLGVLRPEKRDTLLKLLVSITDRDVDGILDAFASLGIRVRDQWIDAFKDDLYLALIETESTNTIQQDALAFEGIVEALRKYKLKVPMVTMLMIKVLSMVQEVGYNLNPEFNFQEEVKPVILDIMKRKLLSQTNIRKAGFDILDAFGQVKDLPNNVNMVLKRLSTGAFTLKLAHDDLDRLGNSIDKASYKILLGLILASIVLGTSLVVLSTQSIVTGTTFQLILVVYGVTIIGGIFVVIQLLRRRDKQ